MVRVIGSGLDSQLHREARERALNVVMEARDEAERLLREAEADAEAQRASVLQESEEALADRERQALAQARLTAQRESIRRRQALLDTLWQRAAEGLRALAAAPEDDRRRMIANLLIDAAAQLAGPDWRLEVAVTAQDRPLLTRSFLADLGERLAAYGVSEIEVLDEDLQAIGGVVAHKAGREGSRQMVDNSWDERLAVARRVLRDEVERLLAAEREPDRAASTAREGERRG
jgi:vacuolar-type H+-ATPase subunit E/Vma4